MTDPDDDAFRWEGDDRTREAPPAPRLVVERPATDGAPQPAGSAQLLVLGVLGGVAVLETALWIRGLLLPSITGSLGGTGTPLEAVSHWANVAGRVLAAAAPVVWFAVVLRRVRPASTRLAWLLLGAVLLVPWPFVLGAL